jgi:hypothetical protein
MINYGNIAKALEFYRAKGYTYLEVPWIVSHAATAVTIPEGHEAMRLPKYGDLVGSAEQSFIELLLHGACPSGKFMAATPCFRDDNPDKFHQNTFFKVELFDGRQNSFDELWPISTLGHMAKDALDFFHSLLYAKDAYLRATSDGFDIELHGIELGSYGIRKHNDWVWVYGTGYADPRFTTVTEGL